MTPLAGLDAAVTVIASAPRKGHRRLVALSGAPASGKSTLAFDLAAALTAARVTSAVLPMDGFHLDNRLLDIRGLRARKGAPETFDVAGFAAVLQRLAGRGDVVHPVFARDMDCAIAGAGVIPDACDTVIVEGNYLMLKMPAWETLTGFWDVSIALETPLEMLRQRLMQRWLDLGHTPEEAARRTEANDMINARLIASQSAPSDHVFQT